MNRKGILKYGFLLTFMFNLGKYGDCFWKFIHAHKKVYAKNVDF